MQNLVIPGKHAVRKLFQMDFRIDKKTTSIFVNEYVSTSAYVCNTVFRYVIYVVRYLGTVFYPRFLPVLVIYVPVPTYFLTLQILEMMIFQGFFLLFCKHFFLHVWIKEDFYFTCIFEVGTTLDMVS